MEDLFLIPVIWVEQDSFSCRTLDGGFSSLPQSFFLEQITEQGWGGVKKMEMVIFSNLLLAVVLFVASR